MPDPIIRSFFFGRALGSTLKEKVEDALTDTLSELGKFDAEQRERLRQFTAEVQARAEQAAAQGNETTSNNGSTVASTAITTQSPADLQETLDELRAAIATLRAELKHYRNNPE